MDAPRICIVGGGSAYMPGIAFAVAHARDALAGATLVLHDVDADALELQARLTRSILRARGAGDIGVEATLERRRAIAGADLILTAFRPGGFAARHLDERIAIDHGVIGQETAGPGGFAMALRSVPIVREIASEVRAEAASEAVLLNYTNPIEIVSEAMTRWGPPVPFLGLCDQTAGEEAFLGRLLAVDPVRIELDTAGVNHMTFTRAVRIDGLDRTPAVWERLDTVTPAEVADRGWWRVVVLFRELRVVPSLYLQYFRFTDEVLAEQRAAGRTRAEEVMAQLPEVVASYRREADAADPRPSMARASEEHGDFAVAIMAAIRSGARHRAILNLPNRGQVPDLPEGAIVETPAWVQGRSVEPIDQAALPEPVHDVVTRVAEHARLAAEAALTGDHALAIDALEAHPLVPSRAVAAQLLDAYLRAHAAFLPAIWGAA
ncbi:MAG TPA: glycoside hydrolase family 4 [Actinomycetota bacterium]|nr:glycoside hydrolase family 4 [Actinomycetota bacterium]